MEGKYSEEAGRRSCASSPACADVVIGRFACSMRYRLSLTPRAPPNFVSGRSGLKGLHVSLGNVAHLHFESYARALPLLLPLP